MRFWFAGLLFTLFSLSALGQASFEFTPECKQAYKLIWNYRLSEADKYIARERNLRSNNMMPLYLQSLREFMHAFTQEDKAAYQKFISARSGRIDQLGKGSDDPWRDFIKAEIYLHSALLKVKFNDYLAGAYDIQRAYHLLKDLLRKHPDFLPAQKDYYLLTSAVGTVPDNYQWLLRILGFDGNLSSSMEWYEQLLKDLKASPEYNVFLKESRIYYGYMSYYLANDHDKAWEYVKLATTDYSSNPVSAFIRSSMAMRRKDNNHALEILKPHVKDTPAFPHLDYLMGNAQLYKINKEAGFYFARYLKTFKGTSYVKDAYLKLAWAFLLNDDAENYAKCLRLLQHYGNEALEEDKQAMLEAQKTTDPASVDLLRARLYYDGGYYRESNAILRTYDDRWARDLTKEQQAEYWYRSGRVEDAIDNREMALKNYLKVSFDYSDVKNYYPPAACFYAGYIYEKDGNKKKAEEYYKKTLFFRGYIYKDAFDQKAYAGLRRLSKE